MRIVLFSSSSTLEAMGHKLGPRDEQRMSIECESYERISRYKPQFGRAGVWGGWAGSPGGRAGTLVETRELHIKAYNGNGKGTALRARVRTLGHS